MDAKKASQIFGCTEDQAANQYKVNAKALHGLGEKAAASGKKLRGYSADELFKLSKSSLKRSGCVGDDEGTSLPQPPV